jgi:NAD(P)-dependent dehydrogenase (short-subunit alcohol dehydrogenase family)
MIHAPEEQQDTKRAAAAGPMDDFSLKGQNVIVTGAGKGIGRGIALDAAGAGATVIATSRTESDLDEVAGEIRASGGLCETVVADLTSVADIRRLYAFAVDRVGNIHGVVNNAGFNRLRDALDYDEAEVDELFGINLKAVYWSCVIAARIMIDQGVAGSIVNITSQAGVVGAPGRSPYSAAKAGVNHLSRSLAAEWAPHGIRVNAVAPTVTATPLGLRAMEQRPEFAAEVSKRIALRGRAAEVSEISRPVLFMLSPASGLITGQTLVVDGGWTL